MGSERLGRGRRLRGGRARARPYSFASQRWVDEGRTRHYVLVPARDDHVDAWFRLSFGAQQAHGITEVDGGAWPPGTRHAEHRDLEALLDLAPLISGHHEAAPVFSGIEWDEDPEELRALLAADVADDEIGEVVYERDGRVVAIFELAPVEKVSMHRGPAQPDRAAIITFAASLPDVRGSGAGLALTRRRSHGRTSAPRVRDARHRLAGNQPRLFALLADPRVPPLLPAALPLDPVALS